MKRQYGYEPYGQYHYVVDYWHQSQESGPHHDGAERVAVFIEIFYPFIWCLNHPSIRRDDDNDDNDEVSAGLIHVVIEA